MILRQLRYKMNLLSVSGKHKFKSEIEDGVRPIGSCFCVCY